MSKIKIVGYDPSTSHWGICRATVDVHSLEFTIDQLTLVNTESEVKKGVRKDSDDLRRAGIVRAGMLLSCTGAALAISEIPFMNPGSYASANFNSGLVTGVLAGCPIPLIQVFPQDVKLATVGVRNAAKEEVIAWAMEMFPDAPWLMRKLRGKMVPVMSNEHLADAVASIYAGLRTEQFGQAVSMFKAMAA